MYFPCGCPDLAEQRGVFITPLISNYTDPVFLLKDLQAFLNPFPVFGVKSHDLGNIVKDIDGMGDLPQASWKEAIKNSYSCSINNSKALENSACDISISCGSLRRILPIVSRMSNSRLSVMSVSYSSVSPLSHSTDT